MIAISLTELETICGGNVDGPSRIISEDALSYPVRECSNGTRIFRDQSASPFSAPFGYAKKDPKLDAGQVRFFPISESPAKYCS